MKWLINLSCVLAITVMAGCATTTQLPEYTMYTFPSDYKVYIGTRKFVNECYHSTTGKKQVTARGYCNTTERKIYIEYDLFHADGRPDLKVAGEEFIHAVVGAKWFQ